MHVDLLIHSITQLVTCAADSPKRSAAMTDVGIIEDGAVAVDKGMIVDVGKSEDLVTRHTAEKTLNAEWHVICPGFVDAHTHIVYAGDRAAEFELRIKGATYMEIMAAGGGILSTMRKLRDAGVDQLIHESVDRLEQMLRHGTTTVEIKTGYGLDAESELKMLMTLTWLYNQHPVDIVPTFLGAHAIPPEYEWRAEEYTQYVIDTLIPMAAEWYRESDFSKRGVPFFIDVFCEQNAFSLDQSRRVLEAGVAQGMRVKAHVDEFVNLGGAKMAIDLGAVSIDHLDVTSVEEVQHLAHSDTVSVIIPAVNFNFGSTHFADARGMIDAGAAVALATDFNPGSAPCPSMPMVMAIACRYQKLLPSEALNASTINAAYAVGMGDKVGSIQVGKQADLLIIDAPDYRHLAYQFGGNLVKQVIKRGHIV
jgi:imidazolonepropionase